MLLIMLSAIVGRNEVVTADAAQWWCATWFLRGLRRIGLLFVSVGRSHGLTIYDLLRAALPKAMAWLLEELG